MSAPENPQAFPREFRFGKWTIYYDPPPIPTRKCDWHYWHEDDDGAPDGSTARSGSAGSAQACLDEIAVMVAEMWHPIPQDPPKGQPCAHGHFGCSSCSV